MNTSYYLLFVSLLLLVAVSSVAQPPGEPRQMQTASAELFPNLSVSLSDHAAVKLAFIKTDFVNDDLIKLDVAVLLRNNVPYFFLPHFDYDILVKDAKGNKIRIKPFMVVDGYPKYEKSLRTMYTDSTYLIVGCKGYARTNSLAFEAAEDLDNPEELFNSGIFGEAIDGCLDVNKTGPLWVTVEVSNRRVVLEGIPNPTRTLVGSVRSLPITITISP